MHIKTHKVRGSKGKVYTYHQLVESCRNQHGAPTHRVIAELGTLRSDDALRLARRFAQLAGKTLPEDDQQDVDYTGERYFGAPLLIETLMRQLSLDQFLQDALKKERVNFDVLCVVKAMLCAHLFKSGSKAEWAVWEWQQKLFGFEGRWPDVSYHHFLRALAVLKRIRPTIEEQLLPRLINLFDIDVDIVFYDLTSSYVEGRAEWSDLLRRGYSRDNRPDCKQCVLGLVVSREGFPITFRVFEGNRLDGKTLKEMVADLHDRFAIRQCIWVADAGLLSKENQTMLEESGHPYILGAGSGISKELREAILSTVAMGPGQSYRGAQVWDIELEGAAFRRVVVLESAGRREKNNAILEKRLEAVRVAFRALEKQVREGHVHDTHTIRTKAEKALHRSRVKKYFRYEIERDRFVWSEDEAALSERRANGGKYALMTNARMSKEDIIDAYRTLLAAEDCFRALKEELDCRPLWHKHDENVEGHMVLSVWSLLLYRTLEQNLERAGLLKDLTTAKALNAVKEYRALEVSGGDKAEWRLFKANRLTQQIFGALGLEDTKEAFKEWSASASPYKYERRCTTKNAELYQAGHLEDEAV